MKLEAAKSSSKASRDKRFTKSLEELRATLDDAKLLGAQSAELLQFIGELGSKLHAIGERRASIEARIDNVIRATTKTDREREQRRTKLNTALTGMTLPNHTLRALWASGLGRTGVALSTDHFQLKPFAGVTAEAGTQPVDSQTTA